MVSKQFSEDQIIKILRDLQLEVDNFDYDLNKENHICSLYMSGEEFYKIGYFPKEICELKFLKELIFTNQNINSVPECLIRLTELCKLDLSDNKIKELPPFIGEFPNLKNLFVANRLYNLPKRNLLEFIELSDFKCGMSLKEVSERYEEYRKKNRLSEMSLKENIAKEKNHGN